MSSRRQIVRRSADRDVDNHADYIARSNLHSSHRFLLAVDETYLSIADQPGLGGPWDSTDAVFSHLRIRPEKGFPHHLVFYFEREDAVVIVRVLHSSQDIETQLSTTLNLS